MIQENTRKVPNGILVLIILLTVQAMLITLIVKSLQNFNFPMAVSVGFLEVFAIFLMFGLFMVQPKMGKVLQLFGNYVGTVREPGLRWANPFYTKRAVSLRVRNFES